MYVKETQQMWIIIHAAAGQQHQVGEHRVVEELVASWTLQPARINAANTCTAPGMASTFETSAVIIECCIEPCCT
jgi:hypothetical protein